MVRKTPIDLLYDKLEIEDGKLISDTSVMCVSQSPLVKRKVFEGMSPWVQCCFHQKMHFVSMELICPLIPSSASASYSAAPV